MQGINVMKVEFWKCKSTSWPWKYMSANLIEFYLCTYKTKKVFIIGIQPNLIRNVTLSDRVMKVSVKRHTLVAEL